jgi:hypothetical protein
VGAAVNILGTNLTEAASVNFNGKLATFTVVSSSEITTCRPQKQKSPLSGLRHQAIPSCNPSSTRSQPHGNRGQFVSVVAGQNALLVGQSAPRFKTASTLEMGINTTGLPSRIASARTALARRQPDGAQR